MEIRYLLRPSDIGLDLIKDTPLAVDLKTMTVHNLRTDEFAVLEGSGIDLVTMLNLTPEGLDMFCHSRWQKKKAFELFLDETPTAQIKCQCGNPECVAWLQIEHFGAYQGEPKLNIQVINAFPIGGSVSISHSVIKEAMKALVDGVKERSDEDD